MNADNFAALRQSMIEQIAVQAIYVSARVGKAAFARRVMQVMNKVPRHAFVPIELQPYAYANSPLPIGFEKTISQPFIVVDRGSSRLPGGVHQFLKLAIGLPAAASARTLKRGGVWPI